MKNETGYKRVLSKKDVIALSFGAMIGWGWIVMSGDWISQAGPLGAMLAFVLGGIMVYFVGQTYAELTAAMPKCGGEHVFTHRAFGYNTSFIATWSIIFGYITVVAFEAVAFPTVLEYLIPSYVGQHLYTVAGYDVHFNWIVVGIVSAAVITLINYIGIKPTAFIQGILTLLIAIVGLVFVGGALAVGDFNNLQPVLSKGTDGIYAVLIMTPFMFVGFDVIPQAAEEINMPYKSIGKVLMLSVVMAVAWYVLIILGVSLALGESGVALSNLATADAMKAIFFESPVAGKIMVIAGIGGIITSWNSFFVGGSRAIYSMAKSGMLPEVFAKLHPKYNTPYNAVLLIGGLSTIAPLFGRSMMVWLVNAGGFAIVFAYLIVAMAFLALRHHEPDMPRPYKVKFGMPVGFIAIILTGMMVVLYMPGAAAALSQVEWNIAAGWYGLGAVMYASTFIKKAYRRHHQSIHNKMNTWKWNETK